MLSPASHSPDDLSGAAKAGIAYFGLVFTAGFVFGVVRTVWMTGAAQLPAWLAVLIELPFMLALSWWVCGLVVHRFAVPHTLALRALMGATAFALLMAAEVAVGLLLLDRSLSDHLAGYLEAGSALGLLGQVVFALFPLVRR